MTIQFDPTTLRILQRTLRDAFPNAEVHQHDCEALALALHDPSWNTTQEPLPAELKCLDFTPWSDQLAQLARSELPGGAEAEGVTRAPRAAGDAVRYYWAEATHARLHPEGYAPFVGKLPMVRVRLPDRTPHDFVTALGTLEQADHLIATVFEANDKYAGKLGYALQRVDVITPPRQVLRFGAVSVMLGYRDATALPSCYILEAGTATGQAKVLFLGATMDSKINSYSGYQPTPFSCSDNAYTGTLTLAGDSPVLLHVTSRKIIDHVSQPAYIDIRVQFSEETTQLRNIWSGLLIARAALIVQGRKDRGLAPGCEKREVPA
jgi:hypothetical protein